jgi:4-hydroxybenzoate polyprenyltransferase
MASNLGNIEPTTKNATGFLFTIRAFLIAIRPHHWSKNLLVFVPLIVSHNFGQPAQIMWISLAFLIFCLVASAGYLINDLLDLQADREHPVKCKRPFASGALSIFAGKVGVIVIVALAALLSIHMPNEFIIILVLYLAVTILYTSYMKREPIIDVLILGGLYTLRIFAGCVAISVKPSFWLLAFSMFFFLSLAMMKRFTELDEFVNRGEDKIPRRGYINSDLKILSTMGLTSGYISVLVLAFYVNSREIRLIYTYPHYFWMLCILTFYWISWVWLLAHRGQMHIDPITFAITDRVSLTVMIMCVITIFLSA